MNTPLSNTSGIRRNSGLTTAKTAATGCGGSLNHLTRRVCARSAPAAVANQAEDDHGRSDT